MFSNVDKELKVLSIYNDDDIPKVIINDLPLIKMKEYVDQCDDEISWLGTVDVNTETNTYTITDVMLLEQEVSGISADLCEKSLSDFGSKLIQSGQAELFNKIKCWGHSHVNMEVYASGTDEDTFTQLAQHTDYFIRLICNKKDKLKIDLINIQKGLEFDNIAWQNEETELYKQAKALIQQIEDEQDRMQEELKMSVKEEIETNIKKRTWTTTVNTGSTGRYKYEDDDYSSTYSCGYAYDRGLEEPPMLNNTVITKDTLSTLFDDENILICIYDLNNEIQQIQAVRRLEIFKNLSWNEARKVVDLIDEYIEEMYFGEAMTV